MAIEIFNKALALPYLTDIQKASIKMKSADINVVKGDIWEASLLYMQIESDFKFGKLEKKQNLKTQKFSTIMENLNMLNLNLIF